MRRGLDAVEARHADVHQDDVRVEMCREADRLGAVARLAGDRQVVLALQQHAEAEALHGLVVDDEHAGHGEGSFGRWRWTRQPPGGVGSGPASSVPS